MSAAQVTEAHKQLAYAILFASEDGHAGPNEATQLIADSEAAAKQSLLAAYDAVVVQRNRVTTERDQLRAECNNLRADLDEIKAIRDEETARAERAEALHLDAIDEAGAQAKVMNEYRLRAERAEAELAAERARLADLVADLNDACITLESAKNDCDDYAMQNTAFKLMAVSNVLLQYIPNAAMKEGAK